VQSSSHFNCFSAALRHRDLTELAELAIRSLDCPLVDWTLVNRDIVVVGLKSPERDCEGRLDIEVPLFFSSLVDPL
jgi:hypothetical protein